MRKDLSSAANTSNWNDRFREEKGKVRVNYKKIVITGGCGFLGQFIVKQLLETGNCPLLRVVDLKANGAALFDFADDKNVEIVLGADVCDYYSMVDEFAGADCVIHLAGVVSFSLKDELLLRSVNAGGTGNVLRAAATTTSRPSFMSVQ